LQPNDASDLVQDVFAALVQMLPQFAYDEHKSFRAWLRTVTLNKWRDRCKRQKLPLEADATLDHVAEPNEDDAFATAEYRRQVIRHALRLMRADFQPTTWKPCWEYVAMGRPAVDVAGELGISIGAMR
jgi:RNA polymerase sigma-70 factor (ECF subfamily)